MWFPGSVTQTVLAAGGLYSLVAALQQGFSRDLATAAHGIITMLLDPANPPDSQLGIAASLLAGPQILHHYSELLLPIAAGEGPEIITGHISVACQELYMPHLCLQVLLHQVSALLAESISSAPAVQAAKGAVPVG